jgi:hypothetical protein
MAELSEAEQLYEQLRSQYQNTFADRTNEQNKKRLQELYHYYRKGYNNAQEVLELLEKHSAERELSIFYLLLALDETGLSPVEIQEKFTFTLLTMGYFKPKLLEVIKSQFWLMDYGIFKIRPYKEDQI